MGDGEVSETETLLWPTERREDLLVDGKLSVFGRFRSQCGHMFGREQAATGRATGVIPTSCLCFVKMSDVCLSIALSVGCRFKCSLAKLRMVHIRQ